MVKKPTGEALAESEVSETEEAAKEHRKIQRKYFFNVNHGRCWAHGIPGRSMQRSLMLPFGKMPSKLVSPVEFLTFIL